MTPGQLFDQSKFAEAIEVLGRALNTDPHNEAALRLRVLARLRLNRSAEACADLDELIRQKPGDVAALSLRGATLVSLKQTDRGIQDVEHALSIDPNSATALTYRGMINRLLRKYPEALADLDRSISINPKPGPRLYEHKGLTRLAMNDPNKSLVDFDQALALNQRNEQARAARGLALLMKGSSAEENSGSQHRVGAGSEQSNCAFGPRHRDAQHRSV